MSKNDEKNVNVDETVVKNEGNDVNVDEIIKAVEAKFENRIASLEKELAAEKEKNEGANSLTEEDVKRLLDESKSMFKLSKADLERMAKEENLNTKAELDKEKKISIKIPKSELNPNDKVVAVAINGYPYLINRGESVEVPESIAKLLTIGGYI